MWRFDVIEFHVFQPPFPLWRPGSNIPAFQRVSDCQKGMPRVFFFFSFLSGIERQVLNSPKTYEDKFHFYVPFENDLFCFFFFFTYSSFLAMWYHHNKSDSNNRCLFVFVSSIFAVMKQEIIKNSELNVWLGKKFLKF